MSTIGPEFQGVWEQESGKKGFFFFTINKREGNKISGTIDDTLGSAEFEGQFTESGIEFEKRYIHKRGTHPSFASGGRCVKYIGGKFAAGFKGTYTQDSGHTGTFRMEAYRSSAVMDLIREHLKLGYLDLRQVPTRDLLPVSS